MIRLLEQEVRLGYWTHIEFDWTGAIRTACELAAEHSLKIIVRGMDLFHIARLRATRILLNDPPPLPANDSARNQNDRDRALLESLITGIATPLRIRECPLRRIYAALKRDPKLFMEIARLSSIFALKAGFVVEHVLELKLGPLQDGRVHIRFRGRRRKSCPTRTAQGMPPFARRWLADETKIV